MKPENSPSPIISFWQTRYPLKKKLATLQSIILQGLLYSHLFDLKRETTKKAILDFLEESQLRKQELIKILRSIDPITSLDTIAALNEIYNETLFEPQDIINDSTDSITLISAIQMSVAHIKDYREARYKLVNLCKIFKTTKGIPLKQTLSLIVAPLGSKFELCYLQVCYDLIKDTLPQNTSKKINTNTNTLIDLYAQATLNASLQESPYPEEQLQLLFKLYPYTDVNFQQLIQNNFDYSESSDLIKSHRQKNYDVILHWLIPAEAPTPSNQIYYKIVEKLLHKVFNCKNHYQLQHALATFIYHTLRKINKSSNYQYHFTLLFNLTITSMLQSPVGTQPLCKKMLDSTLKLNQHSRDIYTSSAIPLIKQACALQNPLAGEMFFNISSRTLSISTLLFQREVYSLQEIEFILKAALVKISTGSSKSFPEGDAENLDRFIKLILPATEGSEQTSVHEAVTYLLTHGTDISKYLMALTRALCETTLNTDLNKFCQLLMQTLSTLQKDETFKRTPWPKIYYVYLIVNLQSFPTSKVSALLNTSLDCRVTPFFTTLLTSKINDPDKFHYFLEACRGYAKHLLDLNKPEQAKQLALTLCENQALVKYTEAINPTDNNWSAIQKNISYFFQVYPRKELSQLLELFNDKQPNKMRLLVHAITHNLLLTEWQTQCNYFFTMLCTLWLKLPETDPAYFNIGLTLAELSFFTTKTVELHNVICTLSHYSIDQLIQEKQANSTTNSWHQRALTNFANQFLPTLATSHNNDFLRETYRGNFLRLTRLSANDQVAPILKKAPQQILSAFFNGKSTAVQNTYPGIAPNNN